MELQLCTCSGRLGGCRLWYPSKVAWDAPPPAGLWQLWGTRVQACRRESVLPPSRNEAATPRFPRHSPRPRVPARAPVSSFSSPPRPRASARAPVSNFVFPVSPLLRVPAPPREPQFPVLSFQFPHPRLHAFTHHAFTHHVFTFHAFPLTPLSQHGCEFIENRHRSHMPVIERRHSALSTTSSTRRNCRWARPQTGPSPRCT